MTLLELAERVERAEGPDRELDARIWCALNGKRYQGWFIPYENGPETAVEYTEPPKRTRLVSRHGHHAKPVTASIDAAMTLIPDDHDYSIERVNGEYWASVSAPGDRTPIVAGATAALATTAAALKARARASQEAEA